jgi:rhodanese-related sulfurtransferase
MITHGRVASLRAGAAAQRVTRQSRALSLRTQAAATAAAEKFIPPWRDCFNDLQDKGLNTVSPEEAAELLATGKWVLLDVRRPDQHQEARPGGAVNVPMYRLIDKSNMDFTKFMKVVAYSFNGVQAIDQNSNFTAEVLAAAPGKKIVVCCEAGGTMRQTVNFPQGKPSRSLQAAYKLLNESKLAPDDVVHLERGLYGWYQANLPIEGNYVPDLGRTPMAAQDPTLQNVAQSTGYEMKEGDKAMEPAQKKNWFGF